MNLQASEPVTTLTVIVEPCPYCGVVLRGRNLSRIRALRCPSCDRFFTYGGTSACPSPKRRSLAGRILSRGPQEEMSPSAVVFGAFLILAALAAFWFLPR